MAGSPQNAPLYSPRFFLPTIQLVQNRAGAFIAPRVSRPGDTNATPFTTLLCFHNINRDSGFHLTRKRPFPLYHFSPSLTSPIATAPPNTSTLHIQPHTARWHLSLLREGASDWTTLLSVRL